MNNEGEEEEISNIQHSTPNTQGKKNVEYPMLKVLC
jgi:hypothetical protein